MIGVVLGKKGVAAGIERMNLSVTRHIEHGGLDVLEVLLYGGLATPSSRARTIHQILTVGAESHARKLQIRRRRWFPFDHGNVVTPDYHELIPSGKGERCSGEIDGEGDILGHGPTPILVETDGGQSSPYTYGGVLYI